MAIDAANQKVKNGLIEVANDVSGTTNVIVNAENPEVFEGAVTKFLVAENDLEQTPSLFNVSRVIGSPYMWDSVRNYGGETAGSTWYLTLSEQENPDYEGDGGDGETGDGDSGDGDNDGGNDSGGSAVYAPEVPAYIGVYSAAVEQNRGLSNSVAKGLSYNKKSCKENALTAKKDAWIDVSYRSAELDSPAEMDADIKAVTAGVDLYRDGAHRAGVFGSYANGKYELSGKGNYYSNLGSEIKSDSVLGGGYYGFERNNYRLLALIFAGKQNLDISTDDGIAAASTDVMQYGASVEFGKKFAVSQYLSLEPSLGLFYTMLDADDLRDNVGKEAGFDVLHYMEAELRLKVAYDFCRSGCRNKLYVKPSIIKTLTSGGETKISGIKHGIRAIQTPPLLMGVE